MKLESRIKEKIRRKLKKLGLLWMTANSKGWPDIIIPMKNGKTLWVEVKRHTESGYGLSGPQQTIKRYLESLGHEFWAVHGDETASFFDRLEKGVRPASQGQPPSPSRRSRPSSKRARTPS